MATDRWCVVPEEKAEDDAEKKATDKEVKPTKDAKPKMSKFAMLMARIGGTPDEPGDKTVDIRIKEAAEGYSDTKTVLIYPSETKSGSPHFGKGQPVIHNDRVLETQSQLDKAVRGAWAQFQCAVIQKGGSRTLAFQTISQETK